MIISATIKLCKSTFTFVSSKVFKIKHRFIRVKRFLNYFLSKIVLLGILQNVTIYLLKYFLSFITVVLRNDTFILQDKSKMPKGELCARN